MAAKPKQTSRKTRAKATKATGRAKPAKRAAKKPPARRKQLTAAQKALQPISLRLDEALVAEIKAAADNSGVSLSAWIKTAINARLGTTRAAG